MQDETRPHSRLQDWGTLFICLVLMLTVTYSIGVSTRPDAWFYGLEKPPLQPPGWIFGVVWPVLYVLITVSGWLAFLRQPYIAERKAAGALFWVQLLLNFSWSYIFFTFHALNLAALVIILLLMLICVLIYRLWPLNRLAAMLLLPYALWVSFALYLSGSIALMN